VTSSGFLDGFLDIIIRGVLSKANNKVDNRDIGCRYAERETT
jgi:hypothetical protein